MLFTEDRYINPQTDFGFKRLFEQAEISRFNPQELKQYEDSVNSYRDIVNAIYTAIKDGFAEGKAKAKGMEKGRADGWAEGWAKGWAEGWVEGWVEGRAEGIAKGIEQRNIEIAKNMLRKGLSAVDISEMTGLPVDLINTIQL